MPTIPVVPSCSKKSWTVVVALLLIVLLLDHDSSSCHAYHSHPANTNVNNKSYKNDDNNKVWNVIVVGGSSGMGKAAALATLQRGGAVLLVGRTESKLFQAKRQLLEEIPEAVIFTKVCDASDESAVEILAKELETTWTVQGKNDENKNSNEEKEEHPIHWNGLVISAAGKAAHGPVLELATSATKEMMESKVWTAYHCAKHLGPKLQSDSGIVFVAGILN